jgi:hypothetical protein
MHFLEKCVSGNYINFAICEYYNDNTFTQLSQMTLQSILNQDLSDINHFKKLNLRVYQVVEEFFKKHLELMFLRFDFQVILNIVERILMPGIREDRFEIKSAALLTVDSLNEFIYCNLKKPSKKQPLLATNVQNFYAQNKQMFTSFLETLAYTLFFEDHKNVWIFQKCLHSTIVMCEGGSVGGVQTSY